MLSMRLVKNGKSVEHAQKLTITLVIHDLCTTFAPRGLRLKAKYHFTLNASLEMMSVDITNVLVIKN